MKENKPTFDFEKFARETAEHLKSGKPMVGSEGVFTPLLKRILEAALEGEQEAHLEQTRKAEQNRRNGRKR
ncbi:MAG: transposase [Bacteroidia bacterium]|nr:transposase [Bacteroidia bacterium]